MIKSFINNGIKIYSLTSGRLTPEGGRGSFEGRGKNKKKKGSGVNGSNKNNENSIELLHDLEFSKKSDEIKISDDGRYICISGMYPPQVGLYDTKELCIKHRRHFDEEVVNFEFLTNNYEKLVFLCKNRYLEFHNAAGKYYKMRIPREGRNLMYNKNNSDLYICTSYEDIYILNLQKGCYQNSIKTKNYCNNFICKNKQLPIFATGGSDGFLEIWDERVKKCLNILNVQNKEDEEEDELTSCCFSNNGLKVAVGTGKGIVKLYDIRHSKPLFVKDHCTDLAIKKIEFLKINNNKYLYSNKWCGDNINIDEDMACTHNEYVASCDSNCIKIYSERQQNLLSFEIINFADEHTSASGTSSNSMRSGKKMKILNSDSININSFTFYDSSGLCFIPCDNKKVFLYFIPFIGLAPKWCNYLDSITEELEEKERYGTYSYDGTNVLNNDIGSSTINSNSSMLNYNSKCSGEIFDDYIFLTNEQVEQLQITHLKGTKNLIPYLHGHYIPSKVYTDIKNVVKMDDQEYVKKSLIQKKLEYKQQMRIPDKQTFISRDYVDKLLKKVNKKIDKKQKILVDAEELLQDERFNKLFYDPDYMVETVNLD
ncbi:nucleolar protein 10, putative [Plasmodium malariae]|uniref:Nucleolar protein 10, putative n=1 Tax=Plasmodium malariae TaxID=5858 RepID=A0A1C3KLE9_PLAMA|nr:nucleolar protein 10, putative [Plasmodium malariae]